MYQFPSPPAAKYLRIATDGKIWFWLVIVIMSIVGIYTIDEKLLLAIYMFVILFIAGKIDRYIMKGIDSEKADRLLNLQTNMAMFALQTSAKALEEIDDSDDIQEIVRPLLFFLLDDSLSPDEAWEMMSQIPLPMRTLIANRLDAELQSRAAISQAGVPRIPKINEIPDSMMKQFLRLVEDTAT